MKFKELLKAWKDVFSNWKYSALALFIMLIFYSVNVVISNFDNLAFYNKFGFFGGIKFLFGLFLGFKERIFFSSFISLIIISILFGMLFSLILYRTNMVKNTSVKTMGFFGSMGIFLGVLAPGCAACGIGLLSLLGFSAAAITFLPFNGLELSWLAIGILGFSVFKISKDIKKGVVCEI